MESDRFARLTRALSGLLSRRHAAGMLGLSALALPLSTTAKNKKKKTKIKKNQFGCVAVGKFCKNNGQCCSGICQGKKGKKRCKAHNQSTCQAGMQQATCAADGTSEFCTLANGSQGACNTTTGNGAYCSSNGDCFACRKDAECIPFCGATAACIRCGLLCPETGTACVGTDGAVCVF